MREILFKAKRVDNGEWIEGFLFLRKNTLNEIIDRFIIQDAYEQVTDGQKYVRSNLNCECFRVDPKTICQYTGMTDENGKKIWENDIVKDCESLIAKIVFNKFQFACHVFKSEYVLTFGCTFPLHQWDKDVKNDLRQLEVIGNIFDNAELLEG